ncbi:MAG TPA: AarF/UbiB family protein [Acidimicrobiales bacterium]|nr:AarF/UbiB family protein [Acidimicrobiales bacterium]
MDFRGPYADGAPPAALAVHPPSLTAFGWRELRRAAAIAFLGTIAVVLAVGQRLVRVGRAKGQTWAAATSAGVVDAFIALGPTFVKLGQMIASSPSVFPKPLADACLRCLDDVPPVSAAQVRRIVAEDLGVSVDEVFKEFDDAPLSAASIAQVHACLLSDGRQAVLKIQRPAIKDRMNRDLRIMYRVARLINRTKRGKLVNPVAVVQDLHQVTNEELNFALEAHRQSRFRSNISAFGDNEWITAPEIYWDVCGPRVIAMERMYGVPLDEFEQLRARGIDGELVLRRGVKVWMEAALVHGPFHGDVHAGNLWLLDDGRATYLDFGIMGELPPDHRDALRDAQYTSMIDGDYTRVVRAWQRIGILGPESEIGPVDEVAVRIKMVMEPMLDLKMGDVSLSSMMKDQLELAQEYGAQTQRELVLVTKQLMYFERYAKGLAPDYNMARDLFLLKNVFPEAVAQACAERAITLPT